MWHFVSCFCIGIEINVNFSPQSHPADLVQQFRLICVVIFPEDKSLRLRFWHFSLQTAEKFNFMLRLLDNVIKEHALVDLIY